jgi:hypothetical protein
MRAAANLVLHLASIVGLSQCGRSALHRCEYVRLPPTCRLRWWFVRRCNDARFGAGHGAGTSGSAHAGAGGSTQQAQSGHGGSQAQHGPDASTRLPDAQVDDDASNGTSNPHVDAGDQQDDAGALNFDGTYTCQGSQPYANDCTDPLIDSAFQSTGYTWTLDVTGSQVTITSIGFDQDQIACTGSWSSTLFECSAAWGRAGRVCDNTLHLRAQSNGDLTFWIAMRDAEQANCHR